MSDFMIGGTAARRFSRFGANSCTRSRVQFLPYLLLDRV